MIFTRADAVTFLAKFVEGGVCAADPRVIARLNEAQRHLLTTGNWKHCVRRVRFMVCNHHIAMPPEIEKVIKVSIDHTPAHAFSPYYEFLEGGPGRIDGLSDVGSRDLVDLGGFHPTMYPIAPNKRYKLAAFAKQEADVEETIFLRGMTVYNVPVIDANGDPGEAMPINRWAGGVEGQITGSPAVNILTSANVYSKVTHVVKPVTIGYITLYAYDETATEDSGYMFQFLAKYTPKDTTPGYRWYKVMNHACCDGDFVIALVKLAWIPMLNDSDTLLIQSLDSLKFMFKALNLYEQDKIGEAKAFHQLAIAILEQQLSDYNQGETEISVQADTFGFDDLSVIH